MDLIPDVQVRVEGHYGAKWTPGRQVTFICCYVGKDASHIGAALHCEVKKPEDAAALCARKIFFYVQCADNSMTEMSSGVVDVGTAFDRTEEIVGRNNSAKEARNSCLNDFQISSGVLNSTKAAIPFWYFCLAVEAFGILECSKRQQGDPQQSRQPSFRMKFVER